MYVLIVDLESGYNKCYESNSSLKIMENSALSNINSLPPDA